MLPITPIEHDGQRVLLTSQLAECYEVPTDAISKNFNRNKTRYQEEKHYFVLEGAAKKDFLNQHQFGSGLKNAAKLYLWTKAGALLVASSLNANHALDIYEKLADTYFDAKEDIKAPVTSKTGGIQNFFNPEFGMIRTVLIDDEPWFVGKDVAVALGYNDTFGALKKHVDDEDKQNCQNDSFETPRGMIVINESGLYSLILSSKLPTAKRFKHWVTAEVLPAIRKTGGYIPSEGLSDIEILSRAVLIAQKTIEEKNKALAEKERTISAQAEKIEQDASKVQFADSVADSADCILIRDLAKFLKQNGIDTGEKRLFSWLRDSGYLIKQRGSSRNTPTQRAMDLGIFKVVETTVVAPYGTKICKTTRVTGKGQQYFLRKCLEMAEAH